MSSRQETGQASAAVAQDWRTRKVRDWLLGILRFAVTLDQADKAAVLATAYEMDRSGLSIASTPFAFFCKTSTEFCNAIADKDDPKRGDILHRHLKMIDDHRLRRSLEAATDVELPVPAPSKAEKRERSNLWKGI